MRASSIAIFFAASLYTSTAAAYSDGTTFARDPSLDTTGGGGGIYFTGSPRSHGLDCAACHIDGPAGTGLVLSALSAGERARLFDGGGYEPGQLYEIEVAFDEDRLVAGDDECKNAEQDPCNLNLFTFEILDADGQPAGSFCPIEPNLAVPADGCGSCPLTRGQGTISESNCSVVIADGFDEANYRWRNGVTAYSFFWRAPATDVGLVTAYVAGVDGRGPEFPDGEVTSYQHDGTVTVHVPIVSPTVREVPKATSCVATGSPDAWVLLLVLVAFVRLRRW